VAGSPSEPLSALQQKLNAFAKRFPKRTKKALIWGAKEIRKEVLKNLRRNLKSRTGKLFRSIVYHVKVGRLTGSVDAEIFVGKSRGNLQAMKAGTHERGAYIRHPGGTPYVPYASGPRFVPRDSDIGRKMIARGLVTKPHAIRIPKRPSFGPAQRKKRKAVVRRVLQEIMNGYHG